MSKVIGWRCGYAAILLSLILSMTMTVPGARTQTPSTPGAPDLGTLPVIKELPDPFLTNGGKRVSNQQEWLKQREVIKEALLHYEYGHLAPAPVKSNAVELSAQKVEDIGAIEKELSVSVEGPQKLQYRLILTVPTGKGPFPAVVKGDLCWGRIPPSILASALRRGYLVAEFDRTQFAPDSEDRTKGVYPLYPENDGAALAGWAWGYHRAVDFLFSQDYVDKKRIAITGHSRGGKAALLAGALDERIALTAPNGSGCGGGGCFRVQGEKSEDIGAITGRFPYWFHPRLALFVGHVEQLPFDQHFLKALVAPRALLGTEALGDLWANPLGSQVSHQAAREVYRFLGAESRIGIHFREGKHEQNMEDWNVLLDFADAQFYGRMGGTRFDQWAFSNAPTAFTWKAPTR